MVGPSSWLGPQEQGGVLRLELFGCGTAAARPARVAHLGSVKEHAVFKPFLITTSSTSIYTSAYH